jgi:NADPH:quinone reductase-like Zn-dependent oxidoreductase
MKAALLTQPSTIRIEETTDPNLGEGQVLVDIKAAALNHRDVWIFKGQYPGIEYPSILGSDGAGVVAAIGQGVEPKWLGSDVIINPSFDWGTSERVQGEHFTILGLPHQGTFAGKIAVPVSQLAPKPAHLSYAEASALPLSGLTAYRALFSRAQLAAGETCLVTGIGGGVALIGLQFAVARGAKVWVTSSSTEKLDAAIRFGAAGGVNYREPQWSHKMGDLNPSGFDVILDSAGGDGFAALLDLAKPGGRIVFPGATRGNVPDLDMRKTFWKQLSLLGSTMGSPLDFAAMESFVATHRITPLVDSTFPLDRAAEALHHMEKGGQCGKIVLLMN